ncbi:MAG TPA: AAA family ATPase [Candidatus Paceibacterota bacterium]
MALLWYSPFVDLIALIGGPCGGKSTALVKARSYLEKYGIPVFTLTETPTELIDAGFSPRAEDWYYQTDFQKHVLRYTLARENRYIEMIKDLHLNRKAVLLCDRPVFGGRVAYMSKEEHDALLTREGLSLDVLLHRYRAVLHLVTAAEGAEKYYTLANNMARKETAEEARALDKRTIESWSGHPRAHIIDNSTDFSGKMRRFQQLLARSLDMPEPLEKERWFVVLNFRPDFIPAGTPRMYIVQDYLKSSPKVERRVRSRTLFGATRFFYTEKRPTLAVGERIEVEREISEAEYRALLTDTTASVTKTRWGIPYEGHHMELDEFYQPISGLHKLEIEVADMKDPVTIPPEWNVVEVTGNARFGSRGIATGSLGCGFFVPRKYGLL